MGDRTTVQGTDSEDIVHALETGDPFTGDAGFAGRLADGRLVRDVLGRYPLFVEADDATAWGFSPADLVNPLAIPAGSVYTSGGARTAWPLPDPDPAGDDAAATDVVERAIVERCRSIDVSNAAVGFSGGVDSSLLASIVDAPLYTVGFPEQPDLEHARDAAELLGMELRTIELDHDDIRTAIPTIARAIDRTNAMDMAIALSFFFLAKRVADDGYEQVIIGQGADELFGGYEKIAKLDHRVDATTIGGARREVLAGLPAGLERDVLAMRAAGIEPLCPYLGDDVIRAGLRLPEHLLVRDDTRKWAFRLIAAEHLPPEIATRDKTAIQYGNGVATELDRLARRAGFKRRMSRHVARYVESLLDDQPDETA